MYQRGLHVQQARICWGQSPTMQGSGQRSVARYCPHLELEVILEAPQRNMATRGMPMAMTPPVPVP